VRVLLIDLNPFAAAVTPISLGSLAAVLRRDGHRATVLSLGSDSGFSVAGLSSWLTELAPDLVGLAAYQRNLVHVRGLARLVKRVVPSARVVLGGPQAMFMPAEALLAMPEVDFLARGEGELAVTEIVDAVARGPACDAPIPGVTSRLSDGSPVTGDPSQPPADLDAYPSPWLDGVLDPARWPEAILLTSRGCPFKCLFCLTPTVPGGLRRHSVDRVLDEIELVARRGSGRLWFADPNFCASPDRVVEILEGVLHRGVEVAMWIELRADMVSGELVPLMRRAGVERVAMGLESASPRVLERVNKAIDPGRVATAAGELLAAGIDVELFSQYALPGERVVDALHTLRFVTDCGVVIRGNSNAQQLQLYFGSDICGNHRRYGVRPLCAERPSYLAIGTDFETDWMERAEIARVKSAWRAASADGGAGIVT
jgi:anaerobic magnesium-protoporphyrin IX monomethyl ester cyclase